MDRKKNEEKRKKERKTVLKKDLKMCNRWRANLLKFLEARRLKQTKKLDKSNWVTLRLIKMLLKGNYNFNFYMIRWISEATVRIKLWRIRG